MNSEGKSLDKLLKEFLKNENKNRLNWINGESLKVDNLSQEKIINLIYIIRQEQIKMPDKLISGSNNSLRPNTLHIESFLKFGGFEKIYKKRHNKKVMNCTKFIITILTFLLVIITFITTISCNKKELDYEKIDFQTRKIVMSSWTSYNDPILSRTSITEKKLYLLYEKEINRYKNQLVQNLNRLDSLENYKKIWLKEFGKPQYEDFFNNAESGYSLSLMGNKSNIQEYRKKLDSIKELYKDTSKEAIYYEINYKIKEYSKERNSKITQDLKVLVDEKSKVFDYIYLNLPENELNF